MADDWTARLEEVFASFASFGGSAAGGAQEMDNRNFAKFCKDTGLVTARDRTNPDIVFAQVKAKSKASRKMCFEEFQRALAIIAEEKGVELDAVESKILGRGIPLVRGTQADKADIVAKLTDASLYTASHRHRFDADGKGRGRDGRDTVGRYTPPQSATMSPRTSVAASPSSAGPSPSPLSGGSAPRATQRASGVSSPPAFAGLGEHEDETEDSAAFSRGGSGDGNKGGAAPAGGHKGRDEWDEMLEKLFDSFASFGVGATRKERELDSAQFSKLCRDCGLVDASWLPQNADLIFAKAKTVGSRRITYPQFIKALQLIATEKGVTVDAVESKILGRGVPLLRATRPEESAIVGKLTDPAFYRGTHKHRFDEDGKGKGRDGRGDVAGRTDRVCGLKDPLHVQRERKMQASS